LLKIVVEMIGFFDLIAPAEGDVGIPVRLPTGSRRLQVITGEGRNVVFHRSNRAYRYYFWF
jgi:hypothetical protein